MRSHIVKQVASKDTSDSQQRPTPWWRRLRGWFVASSKHRLRREQLLALQPERIFAFLIDPTNVERTAPPDFRLRLLTPLTAPLLENQVLEYQWRFCGRTQRMKTRLQQLTFPAQIEEIQLEGPFSSWVQKRRLRIAGGGTWVIDELEYELAWGICGRLFNWIIVRRRFERWIDFRQASTIELLLPDVAQAAQAPSTRATRARLRRASKKPTGSE